jgi:cobalamin biosynthesis protein CobD/CbiB
MTGGLLPGAATAALAVCLDLLLGEPRRWHPLVGFGTLAARLEGALNRARRSDRARRALGALAVLGLVGLPSAALAALTLARLGLGRAAGGRAGAGAGR